MADYLDPDDYGHWEGDIFVFTPPLDTGGGYVIKRLRVPADSALAEGITRADVVHAVLNSVEVMRSRDWQEP